jgi:heme/copper-type cytochrome/quinol oxidase subunit 2
MGPGLIIFFIVLFVVALVATFAILKKEENKQKMYEEQGDTLEEEMKRSAEYENRSLKSDVPLQIWIYVITILLSLLVFAVYLYK